MKKAKKAIGKTKATTNKGKATTAATAGIPKRAVMNRRKYNEAISGDTMSNYAMYRAGGKVKSYKSGGSFPDLTGDGKVTQADVLKGRGVFKKGGSSKKK